MLWNKRRVLCFCREGFRFLYGISVAYMCVYATSGEIKCNKLIKPNGNEPLSQQDFLTKKGKLAVKVSKGNGFSCIVI